MTERCEVARCRAEAALTYLDHGICNRHWNQLTAEDAPPNALRMALGIAEGSPTATEDRPMEPIGKTTKTESAGAPAPAKTPKSLKKAKAGKERKPPKESMPKKEKAPKEPVVVFAFRLTETQRDAIHKAAGPGKATKFVLAAALAAASGDRPAFEELLKSSQK